jgi:hypothetical protein
MSLDFGDQYLQVARALDPARARLPSDADTNDLKTIDVYTVCYITFPLLQASISYMNLEMAHAHRDGPSTCIGLLRAAGIY